MDDLRDERRRVARYLREHEPVTWEGLYRAVLGHDVPPDTTSDEDARMLCGRLADMLEAVY